MRGRSEGEPVAEKRLRADEHVESRGRRDERGASLILTLVIMLVGSVLLASVTMYAQTSNAAVKDYRSLRAERYAGEGAIEAAINWVRDEPGVATDPEITTPENCNYQLETDAAGVVTVSCGAEAGSGSGADPSVGLTPPEAILALGRRHNQPVPYNSADCNGWAEPILDGINWFFGSDDFSGTVTDAARWAEESIKVKRRKGVGTGLFGLLPGANCDADFNRGGSGDNLVFDVQGKVVAAGRINLDYQDIEVFDSQGDAVAPGDRQAWVKARDQLGSGYGTPGPRPAGVDAAGTMEDSDPARKIKSGTDNSPAQNPIGDIRSEWFPVGYSDSGANAHVLTDRNGAPLPVRNHAFLLDPETGALSPALSGSTRACIGARSQPIVFLPGWYRDSAVLNDYLANASDPGCRDRTFWFAPDTVRSVGGADAIVLDDSLTNPERTVTGSYYFDFRETVGTGRSCGDLPGEGVSGSDNFANSDASRFRLCIGGSAAQSPRVVAGWPNEWSPSGTGSTDPGTGTGAGTIDVQLADPTVDKAKWSLVGQIGFDQLGQWQNLPAAAVAGGGAASWEPTCLPLIGCLWFFGERTLTFKDFGPETYAAPIEQSGAPNGKVYVHFRYALTNGDLLPATKLEIRAKALGVPDKHCATVDLPKTGHEYNASFDSGDMNDSFTFHTDDATAKAIADNCGTVDELNGLFVHFKVGGSTVNWSNARPTVYLDGVTADYKAFGGASFPAPTEPGQTGSDMVAARSDCDPERPGAQFIFGGQSHVYVADGSLEVCAGPYPDLPGEHQQIGVYQLPAVEPVRGTVTGTTGDHVVAPIDGQPAGRARVIGEPEGSSALGYKFRWGKDNIWGGFFGYKIHEATTNVVMDTYTPPPGYQVKQIDARLSYHPHGNSTIAGFLTSSEIQTELETHRTGGSIPPIRSGIQAQRFVGFANDKGFTIYDSSNPSAALMTPGDLAGSNAANRTFQWTVKRPCVNGFFNGLWEGLLGIFGSQTCPNPHSLDGLELDITLEPTAANAGRPMLLPASGCITAHPNYGIGGGLPDCAVLRSSANVQGQLPVDIWTDAAQANWNGRFSIKGTVYTPSAPVEIDDVDFAYAAVDRGLIVRHLRVSGWVRRSGYDGVAVSDGGAEPKAVPRAAHFVACKQDSSRRSLRVECDEDQGDQILTQATVNFAVHEDENRANVPQIEWWATER